RVGRPAHDADALRALVLDVPALEHVALHLAVVVFLAGAHPAEGGDLLALLLAGLLLRARLPERPAREVVVDGRELAAGLRLGDGPPPHHGPGRLGLAPLPVEKDEELLAGGLHAVLAERELGGRLALAQQPHAVAQALRKLLRN